MTAQRTSQFGAFAERVTPAISPLRVTATPSTPGAPTRSKSCTEGGAVVAAVQEIIRTNSVTMSRSLRYAWNQGVGLCSGETDQTRGRCPGQMKE